MRNKKIKDGTKIQCVTDGDNWGWVKIQTGIVKKGIVYLEDGTRAKLEGIRNLFNNPFLDFGLWSEYNPILKKWRKNNNIKLLSPNKKEK